MDRSTSSKLTWEIVQDEKESHQRIGVLCASPVPQQANPHDADNVGCPTNTTGPQQEGETVWRVIACTT
jgi:hypothetical protein